MILMEMMLEVVIGVLVMEVDKLADEVTNMDVDKVTNMMAKITNVGVTWISLPQQQLKAMEEATKIKTDMEVGIGKSNTCM